MLARTVLISGAGIAGPTLAFWLTRAGFQATLIDHAHALRTSGNVIDFWGLGYDIAEKMGLAGDMERVGYHMREVRIVDDRGERVTGFGTRVLGELTGGRYVTLGRSDLSRPRQALCWLPGVAGVATAPLRAADEGPDTREEFGEAEDGSFRIIRKPARHSTYRLPNVQAREPN
jgi:hypothetical protein